MKYLYTIIFCFGLLYLGLGQNVGIGSSNPTFGKLQVEGVAGVGATNAVFGSNQAGISLQQNWPTIGFNQYRSFILPGTYGQRFVAGYSALQTLSQENGNWMLEMHGYGLVGGSSVPTTHGYLLFTPSGQLAVGHGAPSASIDVVKGSSFSTTAFRGTQHNSHFNYSSLEDTYLRGGKDNSKVFINDALNHGDVFIGGGTTSIGVNTLSIAGAGTLVIRQNGDANGIGLHNDNHGGYRWEINNEAYDTDVSQSLTLRYSGRPSSSIMGWFRPTDGGYSTNSDARLKENIIELPSILKKVLKLQPKSYRFSTKQNNAPMGFGFLAQEVMKVFPEMIDKKILSDEEAKGDGNMTELYGMNYNMISVVAIKAIQEQQQEIEALKAEIQLLKELLLKK